jgi:hypothetical protein
MYKIIIYILIFFPLSIKGQNGFNGKKTSCPYPPNGGCNTPNPQPLPNNIPLGVIGISGGQSADPNEIIGPAGYDSIRWVSINDVLNYTILFENDPEFASANAQKVDVRFSFDDKAWMRGFGL